MKYIRILTPVLLMFFLSMIGASLVMFYCREILTIPVAETLDSFELQEFWLAEYRKRSLLTLAVGYFLTIPAALGIIWYENRQERNGNVGQTENGQKETRADYENGSHKSMIQKTALFLVLFLFGACFSFFLNGLFQISGLTALLSEDYESMNEALYSSNQMVLTVLTVVVLAPFSEELIFRGICYPRMKKVYPGVQAVIACAVLFGFYHGNLAQGLFAAILTFGLCWGVEVYHSVTGAIAIHSGANAFSVLLTYNRNLSELIGGSLQSIVISMLICSLIASFIFSYINKKSQVK